jgi:hypothetical protein
MKKLNFFLGLGALLIAVALAVLNLTLPPEKLLFDIGYGNWPWAPPIIFGVVGIILLATAGIGRPSESPAAAEAKPVIVQDPEKAALNKRLENIAWGCFLILWAGSMFWKTVAPLSPIREGIWSIVVGLIFLGLNLARYVNKIKMSGFTTVLGILSIVGGVVQLFGVKGMEGAFLLLILGAYLIIKPWFDQRKLFGKAEEK